jgi:hypothetical protein
MPAVLFSGLFPGAVSRSLMLPLSDGLLYRLVLRRALLA